MNIYDIAREAQVSISTVSRVLNNKGNVNPAMKKRIEEVLKKYDYKPSAIARGMVSKTMKSIAILTVDIRVNHYARQIYMIEQAFRKEGYNVIVCNTGGLTEECARYLEILSEKKVDGLVLIGSVFNNLKDHPEQTALIRDVPVVIANGKLNLPNCYSVLVDDRKGIRTAAEYLYQKGHREILYVQDLDTDSGREKMQGFLEAMKLCDIPDGEGRIFHTEYGLEGGKRVVEQILDSGRPFTGIVFGEDITAIGAMKELKKRGYRVPEDVALTGCNNSPDSRICDPELTTLDNKAELMGVLCARLLQECLEGKETVTVNVAIQPEIIERMSS